MTSTDIVLGIDIGATRTKLGRVSEAGEMISLGDLETRSDEPVDRFWERLFSAVEALGEAGDQPVRLRGVGVGAPNANPFSGKIEDPPNLGWGTVEVVEPLRDRFGVPVAITNDANASAMGELTFGAARGMSHFIQVTLGTGVGSGIVVDGRLVHGHSGLAGELGHVTAVRGGRVCGCGKRGCLETYASATGLCRTVFELLADRPDPSPLRRVHYADLDGHRVFEAARREDPIALEAFSRTGRILGEALADAVALFSPQAVVLFGGLAAAGDLIFDPVRTRMEGALFPVFRNTVRVIPSALPADTAGVLGAAALIWRPEAMPKRR